MAVAEMLPASRWWPDRSTQRTHLSPSVAWCLSPRVAGPAPGLLSTGQRRTQHGPLHGSDSSRTACPGRMARWCTCAGRNCRRQTRSNFSPGGSACHASLDAMGTDRCHLNQCQLLRMHAEHESNSTPGTRGANHQGTHAGTSSQLNTRARYAWTRDECAWAWVNERTIGAVVVEFGQVGHHPRTWTHVRRVVVVARCVRKSRIALGAFAAARDTTGVLDGEHLHARLHPVAELAAVAVEDVIVDELVCGTSAQRPRVSTCFGCERGTLCVWLLSSTCMAHDGMAQL